MIHIMCLRPRAAACLLLRPDAAWIKDGPAAWGSTETIGFIKGSSPKVNRGSLPHIDQREHVTMEEL
jgi:hypothetical protein